MYTNSSQTPVRRREDVLSNPIGSQLWFVRLSIPYYFLLSLYHVR